MEGKCQIDSKAGNEQASVGKMQIKGVTVATSNGSPPSGTCHTEFSLENKYTCLDTRAHHEQRGRWEGGQTQSKGTKLGRAFSGTQTEGGRGGGVGAAQYRKYYCEFFWGQNT